MKPKSQPQPNGSPPPKIKSATARAVPTCQHHMPGGKRCGCPALRRQRLCYFHHPAHARAAGTTAGRARQSWFESVPPEDPKAVQIALREVMQRLISRQIDYKKAGELLYRLQMAVECFAGVG